VRPVLFKLGPFTLYGYGLMIVIGGILAFWFLRRRGAKAGLKDEDDFWLIVNAILGGGFLGGRVLFLFEYTRPFSAEFWRTLVSPAEGFSVLGAFAGVPLAVWAVCRWRKIPFLRLFDTVCVMAPFWHVFGRFGCLMAGCCQGRPTTEPWGIVFTDPRSMVPRQWLGVPLHPAQLYEAAGDALIALVLYRVLVRTEKAPPGLVAGCYFIAYGVLRAFLENYRGDTVPGVLGMTAGQNLGLGLIAFGAGLLAWRRLCSRPS
jgi:phosphatidylglycerol:prolipoprotein diacylglycerol transferase